VSEDHFIHLILRDLRPGHCRASGGTAQRGRRDSLKRSTTRSYWSSNASRQIDCVLVLFHPFGLRLFFLASDSISSSCFFRRISSRRSSLLPPGVARSGSGILAGAAPEKAAAKGAIKALAPSA